MKNKNNGTKNKNNETIILLYNNISKKNTDFKFSFKR